MGKPSLLTLPEDMIIEILLRMPLKSLVQCTCASKALASIIRRKDFRDALLDRSTKMPRLLFIDENAFERYVVIHSVYQEKKPLLSSGQQHTRNIPLYPPREFSNPICGLICIQKQTKVWICNPGAEKVLTLPEIKGHRKTSVRSFFSYDKAGGVFKVLCMTNEPKESNKYQVFTLGLGEKAWRSISCQHHHSPVTQGLCIEGVLYYGALSNSNESVVMSFNVKSEEFTVIKLPEGVNLHEPNYSINPHERYSKLVNYKGNIALVDDLDFTLGIVNELDGNGVFEMWVRKNDGVGIWSREKINIPHWKETVGRRNLFFKGTIGTGELVFAPNHVSCRGSFLVLCYNMVTNKLRECKIEGVDFRGNMFQYVQTLLDHVDSTWLL